jgi:hypothetical protein
MSAREFRLELFFQRYSLRWVTIEITHCLANETNSATKGAFADTNRVFRGSPSTERTRIGLCAWRTMLRQYQQSTTVWRQTDLSAYLASYLARSTILSWFVPLRLSFSCCATSTTKLTFDRSPETHSSHDPTIPQAIHRRICERLSITFQTTASKRSRAIYLHQYSKYTYGGINFGVPNGRISSSRTMGRPFAGQARAVLAL